ncbi:MAG: DUF1295 domain-containing protein [Cyclobacteriaceae bacterium]
MLFKFRGLIPTTILFFILVYHWINLKDQPDTSFYLRNDFYLLCLIPALAGLFIRGLTVGHSPKGTSGRNRHSQLANTLNTTGMYSMSRNPLYLGNFLIWLAIVSLTGNVFVLLAFVIFFYLFYTQIIIEEERFLRQEYGDAFIKWRDRTPKFFPRISQYKPSVHGFNWRKIIRKEKNGIAAVLGLFWLFRIMISLSLEEQSLANSISDNWVWSCIALIGVTYYITVKLLVKFTHRLDNPPSTINKQD